MSRGYRFRFRLESTSPRYSGDPVFSFLAQSGAAPIFTVDGSVMSGESGIARFETHETLEELSATVSFGPSRMASILAEVVKPNDYLILELAEDGGAWQTAHGWPLRLGWPVGLPRGRGGSGGVRVILTRELAAYLEAHRMTPGAMALPCGRGAIKRLRALLGMDWRTDNETWWLDRLDDLADLSGVEFARRHGVSSAAVSHAHKACFGSRLRPAGWWRDPVVVSILTSDHPHASRASRAASCYSQRSPCTSKSLFAVLDRRESTVVEVDQGVAVDPLFMHGASHGGDVLFGGLSPR